MGKTLRFFNIFILTHALSQKIWKYFCKHILKEYRINKLNTEQKIHSFLIYFLLYLKFVSILKTKDVYMHISGMNEVVHGFSYFKHFITERSSNKHLWIKLKDKTYLKATSWNVIYCVLNASFQNSNIKRSCIKPWYQTFQSIFGSASYTSSNPQSYKMFMLTFMKNCWIC
jgi:hypothetical protein